jgi:hypothetical protein
MNCPSKICKQEIPDDSCFCDQCGIQLRRCDKCGAIGTNNFCGKCGGSMSAIQPPIVQSSQHSPSQSNETPAAPSQPNETLAVSPPSAPSSAATVIVALPSDTIFLCHPEGWNMEIKDNDILGRANGSHAAKLDKFQVISSTHAKVTRNNNEWFIMDLKSTNKTYVNGVKLEPNIPARIKQDDVVMLANVTFTVRLA